MASSEWRKLPPEAKQRFKDAAYQAKVEHSIKYPGYRFTPKPRGDRRKRKTKRNEPEILLRNEEAARLVSQGLTGDALHEALAEYDKRSSEEKQNSSANASFPPSFSEGSPYASPDSSSITPSSPSFDINQTHSWAPQPTTFLDLETLWDTFTGNSQSVPWAGDVTLSNYSPIIDQPQAVAAEPAHDSHSFHFDHLLDGYASLLSPSYNHSTQDFQIDQQLQYRIDDLNLNQPPISGTQGSVSFPAFQSFVPNSGFGQSTSDPSKSSAYQNVPIFQANNFFHTSPPMAYFAPL